ncbi:hypothetical protein B0H19DRAFT_707224 [Mycena capillaripes]|nr:hypothetical protein B0H19DRAFT_707224 [Mycena capillaripes]
MSGVRTRGGSGHGGRCAARQSRFRCFPPSTTSGCDPRDGGCRGVRRTREERSARAERVRPIGYKRHPGVLSREAADKAWGICLGLRLVTARRLPRRCRRFCLLMLRYYGFCFVVPCSWAVNDQAVGPAHSAALSLICVTAVSFTGLQC